MPRHHAEHGHPATPLTLLKLPLRPNKPSSLRQFRRTASLYPPVASCWDRWRCWLRLEPAVAAPPTSDFSATLFRVVLDLALF
jgi:hypothetical protein